MLEDVIKNKGRYILNLNDLRSHFPDLPLKILNDPSAYIESFADGLRRLIDENGKAPVSEKIVYNVGFSGAFGRHHITPRGLNSKMLGKMVMVEGVVTRMTVVRPRLQQSAFFAPSERRIYIRQHPNVYRVTKRHQEGGNVLMSTTPDGAPVEVEYGYCSYADTQRMTLQEVPERAPTGQLPCSVDVHLEGDLVDNCKPGDRIVIVGTLQAMSFSREGSTNGIARQVLVANHIRRLNENVTSPKINEVEMQAIHAIAERPDAFEFLSRSFAPSICGHERIKKGLLLMLLGGHERTLDNGTHLRGDCHLLMLGDPSCGKSQLLRFVMNVAPLAISTTGRGTTGVGLTAAVTIDKDTSERQLEAGAMVLADRGIVCIDEFDKMSTADRVAIHEAMEQQTVTITKAGIYAELHARCTVVAAANPIYGHIDSEMNLKDQINFPDSLLSRFDLIFIVRDLFDAAIDRKIARFVLSRNKQIGSVNGNGGEHGGLTAMAMNEMTSIIEVDDSELRKEAKEINDMQNSLFDRVGDEEVAKLHLLRKYIYYAKHVHQAPILSDEAVLMISKLYANLREKIRKARGMSSITTRALEGLIRLATAHAKLKLHKEVLKEDVRAAYSLMSFCILAREDTDAYDEFDDEEEFDFEQQFETSSEDENDTMDKNEKNNNKNNRINKNKMEPVKRKRGGVDLDQLSSDEENSYSGDEDSFVDKEANQIAEARRKRARQLDEDISNLQKVHAAQTDVDIAAAREAMVRNNGGSNVVSQDEESALRSHPVFEEGSTACDFFNKSILNILTERQGETQLKDLVEELSRMTADNNNNVCPKMNGGQIMRMLEQLSENNTILIDGDMVYLIA